MRKRKSTVGILSNCNIYILNQKLVMLTWKCALWTFKQQLATKMRARCGISVHGLKVHSYITSTSAFAFSFDLYCSILENANIMYEHHHLLPWALQFDANTDVKCEQGFTPLYSAFRDTWIEIEDTEETFFFAFVFGLCKQSPRISCYFDDISV